MYRYFWEGGALGKGLLLQILACRRRGPREECAGQAQEPVGKQKGWEPGWAAELDSVWGCPVWQFAVNEKKGG